MELGGTMVNPSRRALCVIVFLITAFGVPGSSGAQARFEGSIARIGRAPARLLLATGRPRDAGRLDLALTGDPVAFHAVSARLSPAVLNAGLDAVRTSSRGRHAMTGALVGGVLGAATGFVGGLAYVAATAGERDTNVGLVLGGGAVAGAVVFGLIGAGIGALFP
jgi:hypothetical protein